MKRKSIITLLTVSMICLSSCGKSDDIEPVNSEAVEVEEETTVDEVETIIEDEPTQDVAEVDIDDSVEEIESDTEQNEDVAENTEEPTEQIDIKTLDKIMYAQSEVNTRLGDSTDYEKVGSLTTNQEVKVTGQSKSTGWYQIDVDGVEQFVSDKYLADSKVEIQQPTQQASSTTQQSQHSIDDDAPDVAPTQELSEEAKAILDSMGGVSYSEAGGNYSGFTGIDYSGLDGIEAQ